MRTAILYSKNENSTYKNIGDYIQTIAAEQYFDNPEYVNLKKLSDYTPNDKTKLIMNGWFTAHPELWMPADNIIPLFISFHITPSCYDTILNQKGIAYLKKWEPIGCRDINTFEKILTNLGGVNAYYSSCLTLTLGRKYTSQDRTDEVYFVDPYYPFVKNEKNRKSLLPVLFALPELLFHANCIKKIAKRIHFTPNLPDSFKKIEALLRSACFYRTYKSKFTDDCFIGANYICHNVRIDGEDNRDDQLLLAKELICKYASAKWVVTSRIHCALPCLGLNTPVIFTTVQNESHSEGRFKGLIDFFRVCYIKGKTIQSDDEVLQSIGKIDTKTSFINKNNHLKYAENLIRACEQFARLE